MLRLFLAICVAHVSTEVSAVQEVPEVVVSGSTAGS